MDGVPIAMDGDPITSDHGRITIDGDPITSDHGRITMEGDLTRAPPPLARGCSARGDASF
jgi:hypothetical protein